LLLWFTGDTNEKESFISSLPNFLYFLFVSDNTCQ
jgi:hypothetical protein